MEKKTEEATTVIPKMGIEIVKPTKKLGEEGKMFEAMQENYKGVDLLNLFSLAKYS